MFMPLKNKHGSDVNPLMSQESTGCLRIRANIYKTSGILIIKAAILTVTVTPPISVTTSTAEPPTLVTTATGVLTASMTTRTALATAYVTRILITVALGRATTTPSLTTLTAASLTTAGDLH